MWWVYHGNWVVQVNGTEVSREEFDHEISLAKVYLESYYGVDFQGEQGEMLKKQLRQQSLSQLVDRALMCHAARTSGIEVSKEELEQRLLIDQLQVGGPENFQKLLKEQGMTEVKYRETLEEMMIMEKLQDYVTRDVTVEEEEIRKAYQEYKDLLVVPERAKVGHVLLETDEEAQEVISALKKGADFQELAVEKSVDPSVAENKGILGYISKDDSRIAEEFKIEAFRLSPGEFSQEPVKTEFGYHVLWNFEKKEASQASYEQVKDGLGQELLAEKKQEKLMHYLESLRRESEVLYNRRNLSI